MVTLGKQGDLHARRQAAAYLLDPKAVQKLFKDCSQVRGTEWRLQG